MEQQSGFLFLHLTQRPGTPFYERRFARFYGRGFARFF
jgi:hypothetical protein